VSVAPSIFDLVVDGSMVEAAARETLDEWFPTYLAELERQRGRDARSLPLPRSYHTAPTFETWPEDQLPAVVIVSPGLAGAPVKNGRGRMHAPWALGIGVVVSARDQASTNEIAKLYAAAVRALLLQRGSLGGFAAETEWVDERYDDLPAAGERTLGAGQAIFVVQVENVVYANGGPVAVPDDPYATPAGWPLVQTTQIETERETIAS
jgi:hypothetical protein